jgi:hypothetical protein
MQRVFHSYDVPPRIEPRHASVVSLLLRLYGKSPEGVRKAMDMANRGRAAAPIHRLLREHLEIAYWRERQEWAKHWRPMR